MTALITNQARAYVNWGKWVADCPTRCGSAIALKPGQSVYACEECQTFSMIDWPGNVDEIWEALLKRPAPRNRNWFPSGHELALRAGLPDGQTPAQLDDETADHAGG